MECRPPEDVLPIVVCIFINKKIFLKLKYPPLRNFELREHIVWNVELKEKKIFESIASLLKEATCE